MSSRQTNPPTTPPIEESFQHAAQHATSLYKDSLETTRRLIDLAIKTGANRRTKELMGFVKARKKRFLKRDELMHFLSNSGGGSSGCRAAASSSAAVKPAPSVLGFFESVYAGGVQGPANV